MNFLNVVSYTFRTKLYSIYILTAWGPAAFWSIWQFVWGGHYYFILLHYKFSLYSYEYQYIYSYIYIYIYLFFCIHLFALFFMGANLGWRGAVGAWPLARLPPRSTPAWSCRDARMREGQCMAGMAAVIRARISARPYIYIYIYIDFYKILNRL